MEASELGARWGHSWLPRQHESRVDHEVYRASCGRSPNAPPDPEMAEGGSIGRRSVVGDELGTLQGAVVSLLLASSESLMP